MLRIVHFGISAFKKEYKMNNIPPDVFDIVSFEYDSGNICGWARDFYSILCEEDEHLILGAIDSMYQYHPRRDVLRRGTSALVVSLSPNLENLFRELLILLDKEDMTFDLKDKTEIFCGVVQGYTIAHGLGVFSTTSSNSSKKLFSFIAQFVKKVSYAWKIHESSYGHISNACVSLSKLNLSREYWSHFFEDIRKIYGTQYSTKIYGLGSVIVSNLIHQYHVDRPSY